MIRNESPRRPAVERVGFWRAPLLGRLPWLVHGVSERGGGVSSGPFASLNLGLHVGDAAESVVENRRRAASALGFNDARRLVCAEQVHGGEVALVSDNDAGRGALSLANAVPNVDALVTRTTGLLLALFFADCVPVFVADPANRTIAVAHAGWRGLVAGVLENTVAVMVQEVGARPGDLIAAVGPCIGACCFAVGPEVAVRFDPADVREGENNKAFVDLAGASVRRLRAAGLRNENLDVANACTACQPDRWFSHRREGGVTGRLGAFIAVRRREGEGS
jgi:hypothetical protein